MVLFKEWRAVVVGFRVLSFSGQRLKLSDSLRCIGLCLPNDTVSHPRISKLQIYILHRCLCNRQFGNCVGRTARNLGLLSVNEDAVANCGDSEQWACSGGGCEFQLDLTQYRPSDGHYQDYSNEYWNFKLITYSIY
jgi:hypothetical protein